MVGGKTEKDLQHEKVELSPFFQTGKNSHSIISILDKDFIFIFLSFCEFKVIVHSLVLTNKYSPSVV